MGAMSSKFNDTPTKASRAYDKNRDGFVIAEKDLELRGPGEMLGTRQTGLLQFKVADLMRDADLLPAVREAAQTLLARWPQHAAPLLERWLRHGQQYGQV